MHKFGKMDCHLHATVPVPCNSKYSMLMSLKMNILSTQKLQCCTIYKNISGQLCRKTNSEPFHFWFGGNELGRQEHVTVMFQHSTDWWLQKKVNKNVQIKKATNKQTNKKAGLLDNQPCEKEHPKMSQLNIPQGNLLKNLTINIYS